MDTEVRLLGNLRDARAWRIAAESEPDHATRAVLHSRAAECYAKSAVNGAKVSAGLAVIALTVNGISLLT